MDCFHEYQPMLVGAGCLALGYMYGRHCRCVMETQTNAPSMSDAACCAGNENFNYIPEPAAAMVDPETMALVRKWLNPAGADWDFSDKQLNEKPERCAKRDLEMLPREKEDTIWNQNVFKKQRSAPVRVRTKEESEQDSDDELLTQRLEFFTKNFPGSRGASVNKKPIRAPHHDVATSCEEVKNVIFSDANSSPRKRAARSLSGLGALALTTQENSVEDICRSPKTICHCDDDEQCHVELPAPQAEAICIHCIDSDNMSESRAPTATENESDESSNARMEFDKKADPALRLALPTSPPPELLHGEEEAKGGDGGTAVATSDEGGVVVKAELKMRLQQLPKSESDEKRKKKANRSCGLMRPIRFWWLKKLVSSWQKKSKQVGVSVEASQSGLSEMANSFGTAIDSLSAEYTKISNNVNPKRHTKAKRSSHHSSNLLKTCCGDSFE